MIYHDCLCEASLAANKWDHPLALYGLRDGPKGFGAECDPIDFYAKRWVGTVGPVTGCWTEGGPIRVGLIRALPRPCILPGLAL